MSAIPNFASLFNNQNSPYGNSSGTISSGAFQLPNFGGSNQYGSYPSMTLGSTPQSTLMSYNLNPLLYGGSSYAGAAPVGPTGSSGYSPGGTETLQPQWGNQAVGGANTIPGGMKTGPTLDPTLTGDYSTYLQSQIGQGLPDFDQSVQLPSTGQYTAPGTLTAPENPLIQQLQNFYMGQGTGVTGTASASGGTSSSPLSYVLPMWQSEVSSMNIPIQEQLANLKEQFGSRGALGSSEMANAMQDYLSQTATGQESLLGQLTMQALPQEQSMAQGVQSLDQSAIQNALQQYEYNLPQNNPLQQEMYGMSTAFPPIYKPSGGVLSGILGGLGSLVGDFSSLASANPWGIFGS